MRRVALLVSVCLPLMALSACGKGGTITVTATFADVGDLAASAPVMMADVQVGKVTGISLQHDRAVVTMAIDEGADVPRDVTARVRRTSLLGERIVDLVPASDLPASAPLLADGAHITRTELRPDLEDLVQAGNAVLQPISASEVATLIDEGYKGFAGRGNELGQFLRNLNDITTAYAAKTDEIASVITSLNQLNTTIASEATANGQAVANGDRALTVLDEESDQLKRAVHDLVRLSVGSKAILDQHLIQMESFFSQMRVILGVLQQQQSDLQGFLAYAPKHDYNTQVVEYQEFNQVFQDFIICGLNDNPNDPARMCPKSSSSSKAGQG
jgi:phospholipid/cholesterol/gamma-HCH transport system substrate-binding protein